ncbi:MAG: hypothetical protein EP343_17115 [Deltaproteobacteria bacterium]|nr:MAG: hypothetical protein EP343_17115 [Deltaproteobacteria bacterium]
MSSQMVAWTTSGVWLLAILWLWRLASREFKNLEKHEAFLELFSPNPKQAKTSVEEYGALLVNRGWEKSSLQSRAEILAAVRAVTNTDKQKLATYIEMMPQMGLLGTVLSLFLAAFVFDFTIKMLGLALATTAFGLVGSITARSWLEMPAEKIYHKVMEQLNSAELTQLLLGWGQQTEAKPSSAEESEPSQETGPLEDTSPEVVASEDAVASKETVVVEEATPDKEADVVEVSEAPTPVEAPSAKDDPKEAKEPKAAQVVAPVPAAEGQEPVVDDSSETKEPVEAKSPEVAVEPEPVEEAKKAPLYSTSSASLSSPFKRPTEVTPVSNKQPDEKAGDETLNPLQPPKPLPPSTADVLSAVSKEEEPSFEDIWARVDSTEVPSYKKPGTDSGEKP